MPALVLKTSFLLLLSPPCLPWLQSYFHCHNIYNFSSLGFCCLSYCKTNKATEKKLWTSTTLADVLLVSQFWSVNDAKKINKLHTVPHVGINWWGFGSGSAALCGRKSGTVQAGADRGAGTTLRGLWTMEVLSKKKTSHQRHWLPCLEYYLWQGDGRPGWAQQTLQHDSLHTQHMHSGSPKDCKLSR